MKTPTVGVAREFAKARGLDRVVIWFTAGDRVGYVSYGKDRRTCNDTRRVAERMYDEALRALEDGA